MILKGGIQASDNSLAGEYSNFNGSYFKKVKFAQGTVVNFNFTKDDIEGEIFDHVIDSSGELLAEIETEKTDNYKIQIEGKEHKGKFNLSWEVVK